MKMPVMWLAHLSTRLSSRSRATKARKVEMRFAHLKTRLRGLSGARDEFHLAAIVQNLKTLANRIWRPPRSAVAACGTLASVASRLRWWGCVASNVRSLLQHTAATR